MRWVTKRARDFENARFARVFSSFRSRFRSFRSKVIAREVSSYFLLKNNKAFVQINIYVDNNGGKIIFCSTMEMRLKSDFHTL